MCDGKSNRSQFVHCAILFEGGKSALPVVLRETGIVLT